MFTEEQIKNLQEKFFGVRYKGASLSHTILEPHNAIKVSEWLKKSHHALVVLGPPGTGKTHLCSALLAEAPGKFISFRVHSERQLLEKLREGIRTGGNGDYLAQLHYLIDDEFLIIDDLGSSGKARDNTWREEILMEIIDFRYKERRPTIFTTNLNMNEFYGMYHPRIASRLFAAENTIIDLTGRTDMRDAGF